MEESGKQITRLYMSDSMMCAGSSEARCRCTQSSLQGPAGLLENTVSAERGPWTVCGKASREKPKSDISSDCRS